MSARIRSLLGAAFTLVPALASAQQVACTASGPASVQGYALDACQKASDLFSFIMPQFGQAMAGGSAILGTANTLGGLGKFSFNVRLSAVDGRIPDVSTIRLNAAGPRASAIGTDSNVVPAPVADVGVGIFKGFKAGRTHLLSIDGLVNVAYMPDVDIDELKVVAPEGRWKFGYGGRVGLTRDGKGIPAISASYLRRELPTANISTTFDGGLGTNNQLSLTGFSVATTSLRASITKKILFLEIGGGVGRDTYETRLNVGSRVTLAGNTATSSFSRTQEVERDIAYVSVAFNLPLIKIAVEAGQAQGGTAISTFNSFTDGGKSDTRRFGSAGVRLSF